MIVASLVAGVMIGFPLFVYLVVLSYVS